MIYAKKKKNRQKRTRNKKNTRKEKKMRVQSRNINEKKENYGRR